MIVVSHNYLNPDDVDKALPIIKELVKKSRAEEGCNAYNVYQDKRNPGHIVFIEDWANKEALNAHGESEHFTDAVGELISLMAEEGTITRLNEIEID